MRANVSRAFALIVGAGIIATITHSQVTAAGGYGTDRANVLVAAAAALLALSLLVSHCWSQRRRMLAVVMALALAGMEAHNVWTLLERGLAAREAVQVTAAETQQAASTARTAAEKRLADATAALAALRSDRLDKAIAAQAEARRMASESSRAKDCKGGCIETGKAAIADAGREVDAAQGELATRRTVAEREVAEARRALQAMPLTVAAPSGKAASNTFGIPAWLADAGASILFALPLNVASIALLMFAGHGAPAARVEPVRREAITIDAEPAPQISQSRAVAVVPSTISPADHGRLFYRDVIELRPRARASLYDVLDIYPAWCRANGVAQLPADEFEPQLAAAFEAAGLKGKVDANGTPRLIGAAIRQPIAA